MACGPRGLCWLLAPAWDTIGDLSEVASLPADTPSRRADQLLHDAFPDASAGSSVVIVAWRDGSPLESADRRFVTSVLTPRLRAIPATLDNGQPVVTHIRNLAEQGTGALLVSRDRQATLVVMDLVPPFLDAHSLPVVRGVEEVMGQLRAQGTLPDGLQLGLTGSATAGRDLHAANLQSIHAVEVWTVIVIVVMLLVLYRAPVAALIPLTTVFFAVQMALRLLALLAKAGVLGLYRDLDIFITVLAYGAGVDYCVFLLARYREERDRGALPRLAAGEAVGRVGLAVTASAGTVICGIAMLAFARFSKVHEGGTVIPLALCLVLAASLTLAPALLCLAGQWAFWPEWSQPLSRARGDRPSSRRWLPNVWEELGPILVRRPGTILGVALALMTPFVGLALWRYHEQNYNPLSELPPDAPSSAGTRVITRHFPDGMLGPVTVLVQDDGVDFSEQAGIDLVARLTERLEKDKDTLNIVDVRSVAKPLGITPAAQEGLSDQPVSPEELQTQVRLRAVEYYVGDAGPEAEHVTRLELVPAVDPLSRTALGDLTRLEAALRDDLPPPLAGAALPQRSDRQHA